MAAQPPTKLIATKPFRYATRAYQPGDLIEKVSANDARLLKAIGKARDDDRREIGILPPPPTALAEQIALFDADGDGKPGGSARPSADGDLTALRRQYAEAVGKRPFPGWGAATLREKIAAAGNP